MQVDGGGLPITDLPALNQPLAAVFDTYLSVPDAGILDQYQTNAGTPWAAQAVCYGGP
jgi:hypothetical protein